MIVVSTGCPASIGPEIALAAASAVQGAPIVLVGDPGTLQAAASLLGLRKTLQPFTGQQQAGVYVHACGPVLKDRDRAPGKPNQRSGQAQLLYVEEAYRLAKAQGGAVVTAAVSKAAIAHCGLERAHGFRGHTEWLEALDGAGPTTMCFFGPQFSTSLVTTHIPVREVAAALNADNICRATVHLAQMLRQAGNSVPALAVASLNPHAGESTLLGDEEAAAVAPGIARAKQQLRAKAKLFGPIGAETAYRKAAQGVYAGVVAMYHDQATIPMKLLAFGQAVNVTMGLSLVRTSVDHGTAYDIAWQGKANATGMLSALRFAAHLSGLPLRTKRGAASKLAQ